MKKLSEIQHRPLLTNRRKMWAGAIVLLSLVAFVLFTRGPETPTPNPPGTFTFAVLGDAPYDKLEEIQYRLVLESLNAHDLSWVIHVGDIFWRPCTDEHYQEALERFNSLRHPVIYTPGDNEWTDCWERQSGGFKPTERLDRIRQIFFANHTRSLGQNSIALVSQGDREPYQELVENARWVHNGAGQVRRFCASVNRNDQQHLDRHANRRKSAHRPSRRGACGPGTKHN